MRKIYLAFGFMLIMLLAISTNLMGGTIYVDIDAGGSNNGTSWSDAYTSLQSALSAAASSDEIWVAKGTYKPTTGTDRTSSFQMKNGVEIYGGFDKTESVVGDRTNYGVGEANETILSGDLSDNDDFDVTNYGYQGTTGDDNCYHVIYNPDQNPDIDYTAILDGFTITGGYAYDTDGAGMYNNSSSPTVTNCTFTSNSASEYGGGMYNDSSDPTVTNCTFSSNSADYSCSGGMNNDDSSPNLTDCTFSSNSAEYGGGMCNYDYSSPTLTNCTFTSNEAVYGGGMYNYYYSSPTLNNCIVWGNEATYGGGDEIDISGGTTTLNYSCYANEVGDIYNNGGNFTPDGNCITSDPCFVGVENNPDHPYSIGGISPCCDTGNDSYNSAAYDIRGTGFPRKLNKLTGEGYKPGTWLTK